MRQDTGSVICQETNKKQSKNAQAACQKKYPLHTHLPTTSNQELVKINNINSEKRERNRKVKLIREQV